MILLIYDLFIPRRGFICFAGVLAIPVDIEWENKD